MKSIFMKVAISQKRKDKIYSILSRPYVVIVVMLFAPLLNYFDRNYSFFFGLSIVGLLLWSSNYKGSLFGFTKKISRKTVVYSLLLTLVYLVFDNLFCHIVYSYFGEPDYSSLEGIKHNTLSFIIILVVVWTLVAFGEEFLFTGYYYKWLAEFFGDTKTAWLVSGILTSIYFGASHYYQGTSGIISISIMSLLGAYIFYKNRDINLIREEWENLDNVNASEKNYRKAKSKVKGFNKYPEELGFLKNRENTTANK